MLQEMDQSEFGQFVAALWERQGWQTQLKRDGEKVFVAVQRPETGDEGLLWAIADDGEVGGKQVQQFRSLCEEYGVGERAVVTAGTFSEHAQKVADGTGIELLDGEGIETLLERKGLTDLLEQYGGGSGGGSGGGDATGGRDDESPLDEVRAVSGRVSALVSDAVGNATEDTDLPVSGTVVAVVVVVALLGGGVLFGPSLPFLGGDDISAESVSPENATTTLHVEWNAKVVDELDPNPNDEKAYYPPAGEQFVVVRLSINNTGTTTANLTQAAFQFRTAEQTYGHQSLADHDGFVDFRISSGTHYIGWTVFSVPEGATGTLVYDQNATDAPVAVTFERDAELAVNVTQL